jgi:hypothetical protein
LKRQAFWPQASRLTDHGGCEVRAVREKKFPHRVVITDQNLHVCCHGASDKLSRHEKCRKFTCLVDSVNATPVVSAPLIEHYSALNHDRNGFVGFIHRLPLIE